MIKKTKKEKIEKLKKTAVFLSNAGYTTREVSKMMGGERSFTWVAKAIRENKNNK